MVRRLDRSRVERGEIASQSATPALSVES